MDSALRVSLLALAFCPRASGWVLFPADTLASNDVKVNSINDLLSKGNIGGLPPIFRWSAVRDLRDEDGLGGGITFAFDPSFCEDMILKFEEAQGAIKFYDFVTCDTIKDVVSSAFATWEGNNRNVYFTDVSNICESEDLWEDLKSDECTSTRCRTCPLAEVVINIFKSTPEDHSGARVQPKAVTASPLATNMQRAEGGSLRYVELQFGDNLCWYVDATFCSLFHNMEANGLPVVAIVGIILGAAFLIAAMVCAFMVYRLLKVFVYTLFASWDTDNDGQVELEEIEEAARAVFKSLKTLVKTGSPSGMGGRTIEVDDALFAVLDVFANQLNLIHLMIALFFLIFPALVLNDIFLPCWNCYDFEAAAVHEIGHILGFDHPDQYPEYNFVSDRSRYNCSEPTRGVSKDDAYDANSVMQAFLPRNPKTCLTPDDLDGLNFLYPVCSDVINESPVCVKPQRNIGWPRLLQSIVASELIPILVILALKLVAKAILGTRIKYQERMVKTQSVKNMQMARHQSMRLEVAKRRHSAQMERRMSAKASRSGSIMRRVSQSKTAPEGQRSPLNSPKAPAVDGQGTGAAGSSHAGDEEQGTPGRVSRDSHASGGNATGKQSQTRPRDP